MANENSAVSVVVDRTVLPGKVVQFENYLKQIIQASSQYPGYIGTDVINPTGDNRYILVFRFASQRELEEWSASEPRNYWVNKIDEVIEKPTQLNTLTGLETWFYLSNNNGSPPPPRYKMAIITYLGIAPTFLVFNLLFGQFFNFVPEHLSIFVKAPFIVILMTYLVMPALTKLFKSYLYPSLDTEPTQ